MKLSFHQFAKCFNDAVGTYKRNVMQQLPQREMVKKSFTLKKSNHLYSYFIFRLFVRD